MSHDELINEMRRGGSAMGRTIASLLQTKPFRPFVIHMMGRTTHEITDPSKVEVRDSVAEIRTGADSRAIISLTHVCSVTVLMPRADEAVIVAKDPSKQR